MYEAAFADADLSLVRVPTTAGPRAVAEFVIEDVLDGRRRSVRNEANGGGRR
jgi:hypothetical protein